jgi:hypothetical protein
MPASFMSKVGGEITLEQIFFVVRKVSSMLDLWLYECRVNRFPLSGVEDATKLA